MNPTETERILTLEIKREAMAKEISEINVKVDTMNCKLDNLLDRLDKKYASKWVERVVKGVVGLILLGVFGALLKLVVVQ